MASSGREKPRKAQGQGIRINSSLIATASSEVHNELVGLGVSVFDQGTFEEGVMRQLDEEVSRRTAEQQQKFLVEEYSRVKQERSTIRHELDALSKKIAALLSRPLCDVVLSLREMKSVQEQKRKQMLQLETREQQLLKKILGEEDKGDEGAGEGGVVRDAAFSVPMSSWSSDQQRLIQSGHMTPFGSSRLNEKDVLGELSVAIAEEKFGKKVAVGEGESVDKSGETEVENRTEMAAATSSGLRLCSEGFGGLFEAQTASALSKPVRKKGASPPGARKKGKGKQKARDPPQVVNGDERLSVSGREEGGVWSGASGEDWKREAGDEWMPTREEVEQLEREMAEESWREGGEEEGEEEGSTEYTTDEELGADYVIGFGGTRKKKPKRRPLSSGESEDGVTEDGGTWGRRRRKRRRRLSAQASCHLDDGDEELFRLRIKEHEREQADSDSSSSATRSSSDKVLDGRLRVPGSIWSRLYPYQCTGVHWLWELHCQQAGGVVGDEMGLGKTIEMIAFLAALRVSRLRSHVTRELGLGPVLVVCPATIMHQWVSEFHTWWAPFRVAVLHETGTYRGPKSALVDKIVKCSGILITTYSGVRIYRDLLLMWKWDYVVLDEGHKIRNPDAEVTLACKQFPTPHRIILSGSPMQNNLRELWSLFDFVFPGKLGTLPVFMEQFSVPITLGGYANATQIQVQTAYRCACILRDTINPYLLRRLKADVKIQLPSKNEQVLFCKLTDYQQELYEEYVTGPDVAAMMVGRKKIFTGLMVLRKLCNHPDLVTNDYRECVRYGREEGGSRVGEGGEDGDEEEDTALIRTRRPPKMRRRRSSGRSLDSEAEWGAGEGQGGYYCEEKFGWGKRSGKMVVVEALLKMWREQRHRVLLFSQSKMMLSILEVMLQARGYSYVRMDGDTPIKARQPLIRRFNENSSIFVFLLTTRVGGLGVNLTGADRVVIYDPDWNPSIDMQARERAWRIGQKQQVTIYRLLTSGTIEEKIYHRQIFKQFLTNRVLKDPRQRRFFKSNNLYELFSLGQVTPTGQTETSAIFAGTKSDVLPKKLKKRRSRNRGDELRNVTPKSCDRGGELHGKSTKSGGAKGKKRPSREGGESDGESLKRRKVQGLTTAHKPEEMLICESEDTLGNFKELAGRDEMREEGGAEGEATNSAVKVAEEDSTEIQSVLKAKESGEASCEPVATSLVNSETKTMLGVNRSSATELRAEGGEGEEAEGGVSGRSTFETGAEQEKLQSSSGSPEVLLASSHDRDRQSDQQDEENVREKKKKEKHKKQKKKKKKKDRKKKKHHERAAMVEGVEISGVDRTGLFTAGGEGDRQRDTARHDDYVLTKLFKKTGVHSAIQHDSIMSSGYSDYVVVETEAKKVAQSAARALRESRRRCLAGAGGRGREGGAGGGGWGQLTWTGQHGSAGGGTSRQQPRFGMKIVQTRPKEKLTATVSSQLFNGQKAGSSSLLTLQPSHSHHPTTHSSTSSTSSSSSLLTKIRSRNAHTLPENAIKDIHESTHDVLMREIRDFIATQCKVNGQATTEELLGHFAPKLPNSDTATFRSMLREICDFSRIRSEGRWILKSQFR